jgi:hypothetical protein
MKSLVGRKAIAQRMPFYQPGTFQAIPNTYAGQPVTIIDVKPSSMYAGIPTLTARQLASLPPQSRQAIDNVKSASTIVVQFADGTKADTGSLPVMASTLPNYLELLPDENAPAVASANSPAQSTQTALAANSDCPVVVTKATSTSGGFGHALAEAMLKSEFQRNVEKINNGFNDPHYLDIRMKNASAKPVRALEAFVVYANAMGDEGTANAIVSQNNKIIKPGGEYVGYSYDTAVRSSNGLGDVTVYVSRVRFDDNSYWQDNGSHSCALSSRIK